MEKNNWWISKIVFILLSSTIRVPNTATVGVEENNRKNSN